jgi:putative ABC transport system permease protein
VNALVIGVFLVVFTTAAGGALRDYGVRVVSGLAGADLSVIADDGTTVPDELLASLREQPGVRATLPIDGDVGTTADGDRLAAVDPALAASVLGLDVRDGDPVEALAGNEVAVVGLSSGTEAAGVGDTITATWTDGTPVALTVATVTDLSFDAPALLVSEDAARATGATLTADRVALQVDDGMLAEAEDAVREVLRPYPNLGVLPGGFLATGVRAVFDALIASVNVLLAGAVVIAVFGIVNTLVLSISERTRELGVLRAVGMSRRQVRAMVRVESVLVASLGVVVGSVTGLFVAFTVTRPLLADEGGGFPWPLGPLAVIAAGGVVVGLLASLLPARRAARLDPLAAIRTD